MWGGNWKGLPSLISGCEALKPASERRPQTFIFKTSPPAWMKGRGRGQVLIVIISFTNKEEKRDYHQAQRVLPSLSTSSFLPLAPFPFSFHFSSFFPSPPSLYLLFFFSRPCLFCLSSFQGLRICLPVWISSAFCAGMSGAPGHSGRTPVLIWGAQGGCGAMLRGEGGGRMSIHSFTVLQIVIEHLLCAKHWLGPLGFSAEQDRHDPALGS